MLSKYLGVLVLSTLLSSVAFIVILAPTAAAQTADANVALQKGYRTGYSDGYMAGYRDSIDSVAKNYSRHNDYNKAERAFNKEYGAVEDYRDGYKQGFESGYETGYERRSFQSSLPASLTRRGDVASTTAQNAELEPEAQTETRDEGETAQVETENAGDTTPADTESVQVDPAAAAKFQATGNAIYLIPRDTELILELEQDLTTQNSREGERFTAKIVSPSEIAGAMVEGHITKVRKPGRIKGRSELLLSFDRILLTNDRWSNFSAVLVEVIPVKGDNIKRVDDEGTALGKSTTKGDLKKVGASSGAGLAVGAIVGGPVGAAVGAGVGAAFGVGAVVIDRGKPIRLNRNQQLRIKTSYETQIR